MDGELSELVGHGKVVVVELGDKIATLFSDVERVNLLVTFAIMLFTLFVVGYALKRWTLKGKDSEEKK